MSQVAEISDMSSPIEEETQVNSGAPNLIRSGRDSKKSFPI